MESRLLIYFTLNFYFRYRTPTFDKTVLRWSRMLSLNKLFLIRHNLLAKIKVALKAATIVDQRALKVLIIMTMSPLIILAITVETVITSCVLSLRLVVRTLYFLDMEAINLQTKVNTLDPIVVILTSLGNNLTVRGRIRHQKGSMEQIYCTG